MKNIGLLLILVSLLMTSCQQGPKPVDFPMLEIDNQSVYPNTFNEKPDLPSPCVDSKGREFVLIGFESGQYSWIDATVENGDDFNYKANLHGKGKQLKVDSADFPHFAKHGWHSDKELAQTLSITGRSVSQITIDGRPWGSSGVGFMTEDETILSVIWGDNKIARKLGLRHSEISAPLFHIWNAGWLMEQTESDLQLNMLTYNNREIDIRIEGSRGWQESIFNDELLGTGHIKLSGKIPEEDFAFLKKHYAGLSEEEFEILEKKLSFLHTGELVLFYINRYGFYEGHNEYRPDPAAIAYMFGLRTIEEVHEAAEGDLFSFFTTPFTENPEFRGSKGGKGSMGSRELGRQNKNPQGVTRNPRSVTRYWEPGTGNLEPASIDSLVNALASAGRNWNNPAGQLIKIGDPAVPVLVELLLDKSQSQWSRRVAAMTLNQIHSPLTVEPGLKLLFDENEDWNLRNQIIPSLRGFDLSLEKDKLWDTFHNTDGSYWGNIAALLEKADTTLAYQAYLKLYNTSDGYGQMVALRNLAQLRPHEATSWYLNGIVNEDWMTANMVMDSLVNLKNLKPQLLLDLYDKEDVSEESRWRIVHVLGQLDLPESKALLERAREDTSWLIKMEALFLNTYF